MTEKKTTTTTAGKKTTKKKTRKNYKQPSLTDIETILQSVTEKGDIDNHTLKVKMNFSTGMINKIKKQLRNVRYRPIQEGDIVPDFPIQPKKYDEMIDKVSYEKYGKIRG